MRGSTSMRVIQSSCALPVLNFAVFWPESGPDLTNFNLKTGWLAQGPRKGEVRVPRAVQCQTLL